MNSYKVTYILNGEEHYDHITERTEKAAQKRVNGRRDRPAVWDHAGADGWQRHHRKGFSPLFALFPQRHP